MKIKTLYRYLLLVPITFYGYSCKKLVEIPPPIDTIVSEQAFGTDNNANSAILGIYAKLMNQSEILAFGNSAISIVGGLSSDELAIFGIDPGLSPIYHNQIASDNGLVLTRLWQQPYEIIYQANACIEQLERTENVSSPLKERLTAEAKFIRSFVYFYLVNYFGETPLLTTTNYKENTISPRVAPDLIYEKIIDDLENSISALPDDFEQYNGERIRVTSWAAIALLSRIYLYIGDWEMADHYSSMVINSNLFSLVPTLNDVFLKNSNEAILQLHVDGGLMPYNVLPESLLTLPSNRTSAPFLYYPNAFVNSFDSIDLRRVFWIDSTIYQGNTYFFPYKYKVGPSQMVPNSTPTEYYMVLRLAEQYLIRAEARAQKGDLAGSVADVNAIRLRAGLMPLTFDTKDDALYGILQERKKELMYEWGHRWLDMKRHDIADQIMAIIAPQKGGIWTPGAKFFPIPAAEIFRNPNLTQNAGY